MWQGGTDVEQGYGCGRGIWIWQEYMDGAGSVPPAWPELLLLL